MPESNSYFRAFQARRRHLFMVNIPEPNSLAAASPALTLARLEGLMAVSSDGQWRQYELLLHHA